MTVSNSSYSFQFNCYLLSFISKLYLLLIVSTFSGKFNIIILVQLNVNAEMNTRPFDWLGD